MTALIIGYFCWGLVELEPIIAFLAVFFIYAEPVESNRTKPADKFILEKEKRVTREISNDT